jgi:hypothetical protein
MSNHYLVVDDARRVYFNCEKFGPFGAGPPSEPDDASMREQPFDQWLQVINWGDDPPEKTDRYRLALPEARALYDFLVSSGWKARIVSLDSDDFDMIEEQYVCAGSV